MYKSNQGQFAAAFRKQRQKKMANVNSLSLTP